MKREVIDELLVNPDVPSEGDGKRMVLLMKYGMQHMGVVRPGPSGTFIIKNFAKVQNPETGREELTALDIYFEADDVATVMVPSIPNKIVGASLADLSNLGKR